MESLSEALGKLSEAVGEAVAWLTLPMVFVTFAVAVLRYVFHVGWIWMQESVIWMHAVVFMLGCAYTLSRDEHVRVDIFYRGMPARKKAWVNLLGTALFLVPTCAFLLYASLDYVAPSWANQESSREAGGLPFPFVPIMKSVIPGAFALVILQGLAMICDSVLCLLGRARLPEERETPAEL